MVSIISTMKLFAFLLIGTTMWQVDARLSEKATGLEEQVRSKARWKKCRLPRRLVSI